MLLTENELKELTEAMSLKEVMFCYEYVLYFNGTESAIKAGYSARSAGIKAFNLLKKVAIKSLINHLKLERMKRIEVSADRIVQELARIAFQDTADFVDYTGGEVSIKSFIAMGDNTRIVKQIKTKESQPGFPHHGKVVELVLHDKMKALELLGKHCAVFTENVNLTNNGGDMPENKTVVNISINHRPKGEQIKVE